MSTITGPLNQYTQERFIPVDEGLMRNPFADARYAAIRKNDLLVVTQRIPPRPGPSRDINRQFNNEVRERKEYVSLKESRESKQLAQLLARAVDTRRQQVKHLRVLDTLF